jgi:hypothetical protein
MGASRLWLSGALKRNAMVSFILIVCLTGRRTFGNERLPT